MPYEVHVVQTMYIYVIAQFGLQFLVLTFVSIVLVLNVLWKMSFAVYHFCFGCGLEDDVGIELWRPNCVHSLASDFLFSLLFLSFLFWMWTGR